MMPPVKHGGDGNPPASTLGTDPDRSFPSGFRWGTSTAAHQVEGGNTNSDWWEFEQIPGRIHNGDSSKVACDHYRRFGEDFKLLQQMNQNSHRLSLEWSRIQPSPQTWDDEAIEHYRQVLGSLRELGISPMVTLHHFTSPIWFARQGGWRSPKAAEIFARFVDRVVDRLGDLVDLWCTINEPTIYVTQGWIFGEFPPGRRSDFLGAFAVMRNMVRGHGLAYRTIKDRLGERAQVGLAHHQWQLEPLRPRARSDRLSARWLSYLMNSWMPMACSDGRLRPPFGLGTVVSQAVASQDFMGVNFYSGEMVRFEPSRPDQLFTRRLTPPGDLSDYGLVIMAPWLGEVLENLGGYGLPVYVTENGVATTDDRRRQRFLREHLEQVHRALRSGVDVRGYYHWSSMDNFEWTHGYSMRFGLIEVDFQTLERRPRQSAYLYGRIAKANALVD